MFKLNPSNKWLFKALWQGKEPVAFLRRVERVKRSIITEKYVKYIKRGSTDCCVIQQPVTQDPQGEVIQKTEKC